MQNAITAVTEEPKRAAPFCACVPVAAIVVCWNSGPYIERCLEAIQAQTVPFRRVILIDNGSEDSAVYTTLGVRLGIEVLHMERNLGFAAANNLGVAHAQDCEYVALVNPDAFLEPDWLEQMLIGARRYGSAASFASILYMDHDPRLLDGAGDIYHVSGLAWRAEHGRDARYAPTVDCEVFSACAAAAMYRRSSFLAVGGFDERFFCYVEDVDLGFRLLLEGFSCVLVHAARARHVGGASSGGERSDFAVYHGHRNLVWCFIKCMPAPLLLVLAPFHVVLNLISLVTFTLRGQGRVILSAKLASFRGLATVWHTRQVIQQRRRVTARRIWAVLSKNDLRSLMEKLFRKGVKA